MSDVKFLAFDLGAESGRAMLGILNGEKIRLEEIHRFPNRQVEVLGHIYWDVLRLFDEVKKGLYLAANGGHGDLSGIGVDTWGVDFGLVGENDDLLGNPVAYRDKRTDGMMEKAFERISKEKIYAQTGIQFLQLNTLYQLLSMALSENPILKMSQHLLFMPDLFNFFLTGEKCSEYTIASTSQLLNARTKAWEEELFSMLGLPLGIMQPIVEPGTVVGPLLKDVARESGMPAVDVIAPACHDTACAVAAVPAQSNNWAYLSSGTWSLVGIEIDAPIIEEGSLEFNFTNEGGVGNTIRFLRNTMGLWLLQRCRKQWEQEGVSLSYDDLIRLAEDASPFRCIVNPDDTSFLNPQNMPAAIAAFCKKTDQPVPQSRGEFIRCILESLALKYRFILEKIATLRGEPIELLHIVGGGSRNEMLNQFSADATGLPVVAGPVEATAIGNVLVQAMAKKCISGVSEGRRIVARSFPLKTYEPRNGEAWDESYERVKSMFC